MAWSDEARRRSAEVRHLKSLLKQRMTIKVKHLNRPTQSRMLVHRTLSKHAGKGGFTYNPISQNVPKTGIAVSIHPELEEPYTAQDFHENGEQYIDEFFEKNRKLLKRPNHYVGGWFDKEKGIIYLDISVILPEGDLETARDWGRSHDQESVYNLRTGETIYVKDEEERREKADVGLP
jgi:hypothetical protein